MVDHSRARSILLEHGRLAFDALAPIDRPFSLDLGRSVDRPRSTAVDLQRSIGAQLLEWPTLLCRKPINKKSLAL